MHCFHHLLLQHSSHSRRGQNGLREAGGRTADQLMLYVLVVSDAHGRQSSVCARVRRTCCPCIMQKQRLGATEEKGRDPSLCATCTEHSLSPRGFTQAAATTLPSPTPSSCAPFLLPFPPLSPHLSSSCHSTASPRRSGEVNGFAEDFLLCNTR